MAWGLEARVPFLDKAFLEIAMNIDPKEKQFSKGTSQETDEDGCPKMEKYVLRKAFDISPNGKVITSPNHSIPSPKRKTHRSDEWVLLPLSRTSLNRSCGVRKSNSLTGLGIHG